MKQHATLLALLLFAPGCPTASILDTRDATTSDVRVPDDAPVLDADIADTTVPDATTDAVTDAGCTDAMRAIARCATLSQYALFDGELRAQVPRAGVVPYDVIAPLFADHAAKHRFLALPTGASIAYDAEARWHLPTGAIVVKTFAMPRDLRDDSQGERLLETRLLVQAPDGLVPVTYVWNDAQTDAVRTVAGAMLPVSYVDANGATQTFDYEVPNTVRCGRCHGARDLTVLGLRTRQLDRPVAGDAHGENQLDRFARLGMLAGFDGTVARAAPLTDPNDATATVDARARSYLEGNCGHCHNTNAAADWSGLSLDVDNHDLARLGVCKRPSSAGDTGGRSFDIVPGMPDRSVLPYRMGLVGSAYRMPEGSVLPDEAGLALVRDWIAEMTAGACTGP